MPIVEDLLKAWDDHVYDEVLKPRVTAANSAMKGPAPGSLAADTYCFISGESDENRCLVPMRSDGGQVPVDGGRLGPSLAEVVHFGRLKAGGDRRSAGYWDECVDIAVSTITGGA